MGSAHARALTREGASLRVGGIQKDACLSLVAEINAEIGSEVAAFVHLDVSDFQTWEASVAKTVQRFGRLDALVNNAGISSWGSAADASIDDWNRVISIKLSGTFYGMKAAIPELSKNLTSSIVNVSSIAGLVRFKQRAGYSASKWGVQGLTKTSAIDLGPQGIRANSIHLGSVDTPLTAHLKCGFGQVPLDRAAEAEEISTLVAYLVSDEPRQVSDAAIAIDGGETAGTISVRSVDPRQLQRWVRSRGRYA